MQIFAGMQFSHQLQLEPLHTGETELSSAVELTRSHSSFLDTSLGFSTGEQHDAAGSLPWSFSYLTFTVTNPLAETFSFDLTSKLQLSFRGDSSASITAVMEGAYKTPPVSHLFSGALTLTPPYGAEYQISLTILQGISTTTGISLFTVLHGDIIAPAMSGLPPIIYSSLRAGFRSSFIMEHSSHHIACSLNVHPNRTTASVSYLFILDISLQS